MKRLALIALTLFLATLLQAQEEPREGQPMYCNNFKDNSHPCDCNRATECPEPGKAMPEDMHCQVFCRHDACMCHAPCEID